MTEHAVVIAGGGPTGMMLAGELALAGVDVAIVERRAEPGARRLALRRVCTRAPSRCSISAASPIGSSPRGRRCRSRRFAGIPLDISDFPTRHNYGLALWQSHFERILAGWVGELGVPILREREVTGFAQDDTGVDVELSDGQSLRADYLVGCDGGRSVIRKAAGIDFPGWDPSTSWLIAEVEMDEEPEFGLRGGWRHRPGARDGLVAGRPDRTALEHTSEPTLQDLSEALIAVDGTDYGAHSPTLDLPLHRHDPAGGVLPQGTGAAGGRRRPRAFPARRTGAQRRCAGCREPRMEAGPGGQRDLPGQPPRHLPRRAAPGRCPRAAEHHGAGARSAAPTTAPVPCATP